MEEKTIVILGVTGSIGMQTLEVIKKLDNFRVKGIAFGKNITVAEKIIKDFKVEYFYSPVKFNVSSIKDMVAKIRPDVVVAAIPGFDGVLATIDSIPYTKRLALATKEALVCAGPFVKKACKENNVELIPVDSEHSAIFQIFDENVVKILITASGGAVRDKENIDDLSVEDILNHPVWSMGKKITVDSSTMVNKAFEVIEAFELFELENIEVKIHPTGTVHGAVFLKDGTVKIHFGFPDMKIPISYSLSYPKRLYENKNWPNFENKNFIFEDVNPSKYPAFFYGKSIIKDLAKRIAFNAADEIAVEKFLNGQIKFSKIADIVINTCEKIDGNINDFKEIFEIDKIARQIAKEQY